MYSSLKVIATPVLPFSPSSRQPGETIHNVYPKVKQTEGFPTKHWLALKPSAKKKRPRPSGEVPAYTDHQPGHCAAAVCPVHRAELMVVYPTNHLNSKQHLDMCCAYRYAKQSTDGPVSVKMKSPSDPMFPFTRFHFGCLFLTHAYFLRLFPACFDLLKAIGFEVGAEFFRP